MWAALALATLTKGLIAPVFFAAAAIPLLLLSGQWRRWRELKPVTGVLLFLAVAAPWHILAGLANPDQGHPVGNHPTPGNVHGFWYFYFVNEHFLRFLGGRFPHDYNKMPFAWYWLAHLVWLFPWSLFLPALLVVAWRTRHAWMQHLRRDSGQTVDFYLDHAAREDVASYVARLKFRVRSTWLLASVLRIHPALLRHLDEPGVLHLSCMDADPDSDRGRAGRHRGTPRTRRPEASALAEMAQRCADGVFSRRRTCWPWRSARACGNRAICPFVSDIGTLLAHRDVGGYTLSMSHFFDLTGPSFAALRLPAMIAAIALLIGPHFGWVLRVRRKHMAATDQHRAHFRRLSDRRAHRVRTL